MNINVQKAYTIGTSPQSRAETPAWAAAKSHARARESGGRAVTARPLRWAATARRRFRPRGGDTERGEDGAAFSKPPRRDATALAPDRREASAGGEEHEQRRRGLMRARGSLADAA
jgi:hypothetical protein